MFLISLGFRENIELSINFLAKLASGRAVILFPSWWVVTEPALPKFDIPVTHR
jgi:hypothetical protein